MLIFDGADIVVRQRLEPESDLLVFCFSPRNGSKRNLTKPGDQIVGSGEPFFVKRQIPAILFTARWNHWWQTPEMDEAIRLLEEQGIFERYRTIVTYGMSMGGYGALMYSNRLHAKRVIAVAPQYSLDAKRVPGERRWGEDRKQYRNHYDDMSEGLIPSGQVTVLYDPLYKADRVHAGLIAGHRPVDHVMVPFAVHRVGRMLEDMGILSSVIDRSLRTGLDPVTFRSEVRAHRRAAPLYLSSLSRLLFKRGRRAAALGLGQKAITLLDQQLQAQPKRLESANRASVTAGIVTTHAGLLAEDRQLKAAIALLDSWIPHFDGLHRKMRLDLVTARRKLVVQIKAASEARAAARAKASAEASAAAGSKDRAPAEPAPELAATRKTQARKTQARKAKAAAPAKPAARRVDVHALATRIAETSQAPTLAAVDALEAAHRPDILARERFAIRFAKILYDLGQFERAVDYLAHAAITPGEPRSGSPRADLAERRVLMALRCGRPHLAAALASTLLKDEADARLRKALFARIGQDMVISVEDALALPPEPVAPPRTAAKPAPKDPAQTGASSTAEDAAGAPRPAALADRRNAGKPAAEFVPAVAS
ncbi:hypothetical protein V5F53_21235 [Xanthobacter sp. V4C-4]|uniref:hypothetical protein n=1 Tax=Xanthobacter cornucopiae TaxID=3119924 RepID=UPI0037269C9F